MKTDINLLPPAALTLRRQRLLLTTIGSIARHLIVSLGIAVLIIGAEAAVTWFNVRALTTTERAADNQAEITRRIEELNRTITVVDTWFAQRPVWTPQVTDTINVKPSTITITGLESPEDQGNQLIIRGIFHQRQDVTTYRRALEGLPWVERVEAPLSNFTTGDDLEFSFTVHRKKDKNL